MSGRLFDDLSEVYESLVDWPKRLAAETPFYQRWFGQLAVQRVVDVACGTGHHAALFHSWQKQVQGADLSPQMIARARTGFGEPPGLSWVVRSFTEPIAADEPFDMAVCVGNSLALAPDRDAVRSAVLRMLAAVRPGGAIVVQVLNLWKLPDGPCVWQKCRRTSSSGVALRVVKGVHRCGGQGFVDLVVTRLADSDEFHAESVPLLGLEQAELQELARGGGAGEIHFYGGYDEQPYDRQHSTDLIMLAVKDSPRAG